MTKHEADVIGGLNMTDQISNEAYKQIMIATQEEDEVGDVLDKIGKEIEQIKPYDLPHDERTPERMMGKVLEIIDRYRTK